nr:MFS transporter [Micrococcus luteus]
MPLFAATAFAGTGLLGWQVDGAMMAGLALSVFALGNVVAVSFSSRLSDVHGRKPLILTGLLVMAVTTGAIGWVGTPSLFLIACLVSGAGTGILNAPQQAAIADVVGQDRRSGSVMSSAQMSADLGAIVGPLAAGLVVDVAGYGWAFALTGGVILLGALAWTRAPETNVPVAPGGPRTGSLPTIIPPDVTPRPGGYV